MGSSAEETGDGAWRWHLPQPEVLASAPLFQPEVLLLPFSLLFFLVTTTLAILSVQWWSLFFADQT